MAKKKKHNNHKYKQISNNINKAVKHYSNIKNIKNEKTEMEEKAGNNIDNQTKTVASNVNETYSDIKANENQSQENRRSIRIASILAISAVMGTICAFLYKTCRENLYNNPINGTSYYAFTWVIYVTMFSAAIIIFADILNYIWQDLKRYDLKDKDYHKYDSISDDAYSRLKNDFMVFVSLLLLLIIVIIYVFVYDNLAKVLTGIFGLFILFVLVICIIRRYRFRELLYHILDIGKRVFILIAVGIFVFLVLINVNDRKKSDIDISFRNTGEIIVAHESNKDYGSLRINIYYESGKYYYGWDVKQSDLLLAKEDLYKKEKVDTDRLIAESQNLKGQKVYWKYTTHLEDCDLPDGKYIIEIISEQESTKAIVLNMFIKSDNKYSFGLDNIYKSY